MTRRHASLTPEGDGFFVAGRGWVCLTLLALALVALADPCDWMSRQGRAWAQQKSKLDEEEEEEAPLQKPSPAAAGQKSKLDEEEEESPLKTPTAPATGGAAPRSPLMEEEEEVGGGGARPPRIGTGGSLLDDLVNGPGESSGGDAKQAPLEAVTVCDLLYYESRRDVWEPREIQLLRAPLELPLPRNSDIKFQRLRTDRKGFDPWAPRNTEDVKKLVYYEFRMIERAAKELALKPAERISQAGALFDLSSAAKARGAQRAVALLATALKEHDSARSQGLRSNSAWRGLVRQPLENALFNVQLSQIEQLIKERKFQQAEIACDRLRDRLDDESHQARLQSRYVAIFLTPAKEAAAKEEYAAARELLDGLFSRYPLSAGAEATAFRNKMIADARKLVALAAAAPETRQGLELLDQAARIWPQLPDIQQQRMDLLVSHPILECAYRNLPRNLSPLGARTPVERHAVSLMFESLVRWTRDPAAGPHYETQLAEGRPIPLAKGRRFILPRNNIWSDSLPGDPKLCFGEDVIWSQQLLSKVRPPGCSPAWSKLIESTTSQTNNPFSVSVRLSRDHWQPLSLLDFMVLPKHCFPNGGQPSEVRQFDENPVGTGPYALRSRDETRVRFQANPNYRNYGENYPAIREIAINRREPSEALEEFLQGTLHFVYDLLPEHAAQLTKQGQKVVKLETPSAYYLCLNYRIAELGNEDLRLAMAHAIDRELILNTYFRKGVGQTNDHVALHGPFPPGSWACDSKSPKYDTGQAATFLKKAPGKTSDWQSLKLPLVYPDRDLSAERACQEIKVQIGKLGVELLLTPVAPEEFYDRVVNKQDFALVYWRHDFQDETFWLWPMLDPNDMQPGGGNFMGYHPDRDVANLFNQLKTHKAFTQVRKIMRQIHDQMARTAVVIPLWRLDTYVAVNPRLNNPRMDPLAPLERAETWRLEQP